jgi:hypothetical protein
MTHLEANYPASTYAASRNAAMIAREPVNRANYIALRAMTVLASMAPIPIQ